MVEFKIALSKDPKSVPALDGLAKSLIAQKRYSAAIAYLKEGPPDAMLQNDLAIAYSKNGNVSEAVQVLTNLWNRSIVGGSTFEPGYRIHAAESIPAGSRGV